MTTNLLYIGKSKSFLTQFGKLEDVQLIYAKDHKDAITICINLKARENIIILYEQGNLKEDVENITLFRKKFYQGYVVLVTGGLKKEESAAYLKSGINDTISPNISKEELIQKIDLINKRQELLYISNRKKKVVKRFILPRWKRFFDITFAGIALIVLSPVFLIISLAIRLYNPQNETFCLFGTKRSFPQNEMFFFARSQTPLPYPFYTCFHTSNYCEKLWSSR